MEFRIEDSVTNVCVGQRRSVQNALSAEVIDVLG